MDIGLWAAIFGAAGMIFALGLYFAIKRQGAGTPRMQEIALAIHTGAMAFLKREYSILSVFVVVVAALLYWGIGWQTSLAFVAGALCSILAGLSGMQRPEHTVRERHSWSRSTAAP
jgi:K(+)-stimulated pyrophosphate-energized sodium pump